MSSFKGSGKEITMKVDDDEPDEWSVFSKLPHNLVYFVGLTQISRDKRIFSTGCSSQ